VIESFLPCSRCSVQRCSQSVLERPKNHQTHSPQRRTVTQCQNSQHPMAEPENTKEKKRACAKTTKGPPPAPGRCAATTCKSARAASDGFGVPRNEAPLPPKCTMIVAPRAADTSPPMSSCFEQRARRGRPRRVPRGELCRALAAPIRLFHVASPCAPCPSTDAGTGALRGHGSLVASTTLSLSLSVFCLSWARIPFQDLLARFQ
jgi:hypothetical protein